MITLVFSLRFSRKDGPQNNSSISPKKLGYFDQFIDFLHYINAITDSWYFNYGIVRHISLFNIKFFISANNYGSLDPDNL